MGRRGKVLKSLSPEMSYGATDFDAVRQEVDYSGRFFKGEEGYFERRAGRLHPQNTPNAHLTADTLLTDIKYNASVPKTHGDSNPKQSLYSVPLHYQVN